jgi:hypothetical protein
MSSERKRTRPLPRTPVALSVLNLLAERPMHPYEMRVRDGTFPWPAPEDLPEYPRAEPPGRAPRPAKKPYSRYSSITCRRFIIGSE